MMLELKHIQKRYEYQKVIDDISIVFPDTGMVAIIGPSGCGKSTLLNIIGGIDNDFNGELIYNHHSVKKLSSYRKKHVSFIFQNLHLIMWLSVQNNIKLSQYFHKHFIQESDLDISDFKNLKISALSFGQRQKLAYLRACFQYKDILLCDEPTGSLDPANAEMIMQYLQSESKNKLVIIVSHDYHLVEKYCHEIYEMKDGHIITHRVCQQSFQSLSTSHSQKKKRFSYLQMAYYSLMAHKKRTLQMIFGFSLSLLCVLITLTMSMTLENQIYEYINSLIPPSSISVQSLQQSMDNEFVNEIKKTDGILRAHLFLDDYESLGIGFKGERYQSSQVLFIGDDTSPYEHLAIKCGRFPSEDNEIMVSLSTAKHLCGSEDVNELLDKKIYSWYKHDREVISITYHIVGITNQTTAMDTLYQRENAYIRLLEKENQINVQARLGIIFVDQEYQRSKIIQKLEYEYPQYKFIETGTSTKMQVSSTMKQIKIVLYIFSSLALLSSLFLIGEVMFFNSLQKKKDYAIMICFGASFIDFLHIILWESLDIVLISISAVFMIYVQVIHFLNVFLKDMLLNDSFVIKIDYSLLLVVVILAFFLILISQIAPMIYIRRLNTIEALKD